MPDPKRQFVLQIVYPDGQKVDSFNIGPHEPHLRPEDIFVTHKLWLDITRLPGLDKLHHADILSLALTRFAREYTGRDREDILKEFRKSEDKRLGRTAARLGEAPAGGDGKSAADQKEKKEPPSPPITGP